MSISKTKIFNLALEHLGITSLIQNSVSETPEAIIMNNFYEIARDTVLEDHDWSFACGYQKLETKEIESLDPNYPFVFDYPQDCISPRAIISPYDNKEKKCIPAIDDKATKVILGEIDNGILRYTKRITNDLILLHLLQLHFLIILLIWQLNRL